VQQDRAVLEDHVVASELRRSAHLSIAHTEIGTLLSGEADRPCGTVVARDLRVHSE
jgi:hypothetical protein